MSFGAAEARREKSLNQFPGSRVADDQAAEADHVQVVVLDALVRGKRLMNQARANTRHLVGRDRSPNAAARKWRCHDLPSRRKLRVPMGQQNPDSHRPAAAGGLQNRSRNVRSRAASRLDVLSRQSHRGPRRFRSAAASSAPLGWSQSSDRCTVRPPGFRLLPEAAPRGSS